jgi:flagella basal body P-ring formation protein FlgA
MARALSMSRRIVGLVMAASCSLAGFSLTVSAEIRELPVPATTIYPDTTITGTAVKNRSFRVTATSIAGFATDQIQVVGMQTRTRLTAGKPIRLSSLTKPVAIRRGKIVSAVYEDAGFSISVSLLALQDGIAGDTIEARNTTTGVVVQATVLSSGTLLVGER